ncbi:MAG: 23S rRNA pseudouridine(2604) synthase RluF, partial [Pantoea sp.]|nr:23S rRNA pseudouridine(2604) synthase RluF [Pantoea sp.]
ENSSSEDKPAKKAPAKTAAAKKPQKSPSRPAAGKAEPDSASRKRFAQPGRRKKGR